MTQTPAQFATRLGRVRARDGLQNFEARVGIGTDNMSSASRYGYNPITRARQELDNMYRGSWIVRAAVRTVADDMTRAGVEITGAIEPDEIDVLQSAMRRLDIWGQLARAASWGRLYGGAIAVMLVDGQDFSQPLRPETVRQDQFRGLMVLDRWMLQPSTTEFIKEYGPELGKPAFYDITINDRSLPTGRIHYSRVIRFEGDDLPYYQRQYEMGWGLSVVEPFYDRLVAFDSTTLGTAQMVYRAYLRTIKVKNFRNAIASGGKAYEGQIAWIDMVRKFQSNEGLTVLDSEDDFTAQSYSFAGLSDVIMQMAQQVSGATGIPLVKLFGMSPAGFSTGETDLRSYYDNISLRQERGLRRPLGQLLDVLHRSELGREPNDDFGFEFQPLWGLSDKEKSEIASADATTIASVEGAAIIPRSVALKELRQSSRLTGLFSNITDEMIEEAEQEESMPTLPEAPLPGQESEELPGAAGEPGAENALPEPANEDDPGTVGDPPAWLRIGKPRLGGMPG